MAELPPHEREPWPIAGHILLSPVTIEGSRDLLGLVLVTLAVAPAHQRRGIGTRLVEAALRQARLLGHAYVVVVGDLSYYARFGFVPASRFALARSVTRLEPDLLAMELFPHALLTASGVVHFHRALGGSSNRR